MPNTFQQDMEELNQLLGLTPQAVPLPAARNEGTGTGLGPEAPGGPTAVPVPTPVPVPVAPSQMTLELEEILGTSFRPGTGVNAPVPGVAPATVQQRGPFMTGLLQGWNQAQRIPAQLMLESGLQVPDPYTLLDPILGTGTGQIEQAVSTKDLQDYYRQQVQEEQSYQTPAAAVVQAQEFQKTEGAWNKLKKLVESPDLLGVVLGQSAASSIPSAIGGLIGGRLGPAGAAAGVGLGSGIVEYAASMEESMAERGLNFGVPEQLEKALGDAELMKSAQDKAKTRGLTIGLFDAITNGIAGKVTHAVTRSINQIARGGRLVGPVAGVATEMAGAGAGEASAELLTEGRVDVGNVILETAGEGLGGSIELATNLLGVSDVPGASVQTPPTAAQVGAAAAAGPGTSQGGAAPGTGPQTPPPGGPSGPPPGPGAQAAGAAPPPPGGGAAGSATGTAGARARAAGASSGAGAGAGGATPPPGSQTPPPPPPGAGTTGTGAGAGPAQPPPGGTGGQPPPPPPGGGAAGAAGAGTQTPPPPPGGGFRPVPEEQRTPFEETPRLGRTLFGFDTGQGTTRVGTYEEAEREAGIRGTRKGQIFAIDPTMVNAKERDRVAGGHEAQTLPASRLSAGVRNDPGLDRQLQELMARQGDRPLGSHIVNLWKSRGAQFYVKGGPAFKGDTSQFAIRPRMIDYAGISTSPGLISSLTTNSSLEGFDRSDNPAFTHDLDLNKIMPGQLLPTIPSLVLALETHGESLIKELAVAGGSTPAMATQAVNELRSGGSTHLTRAALRDGSLKFMPDPRLYVFGAEVGNEPGSLESIKEAAVPRPKGVYSGRKMGDPITTRPLMGIAMAPAPGRPMATMKDPKQVMLQADAKTKQTINLAVDLMGKLLVKLKRNFPVTVIVGNTTSALTTPSEMRNVPADVNGQYRVKGLTAQIHLNLGALRTTYEVYRTLFHEFGHHLAASGLWQQTPETRSRVWAAYRRFLLTTTKLGEAEVNARGRTPGYAGGSTAYAYSFEEWFADQIVRWTFTEERMIGQIAKVARPLANDLKVAAEEFARRDPTNQFKPEPEILAMMEETLKGNIGVDWAFDLSRAHSQQTQGKNNKATRGQDFGPQSPMTVQSTGVREMFKRFEGLDTLMNQANAQSQGWVPPLGQILGNTDRFNWFYKFFLTLPQVAARNPGLVGLQLYRELVQMAQLEQSTIMTAAKVRLDEWRALGKDQAENLGQMLFALTQMAYLTPAEQAQGVVRQPTLQEFQQLVTQFGLSGQAVTVLGNIRQDFHVALDRYVNQLVQAANAITDPVARVAAVKNVQDMKAALLKRPYFPMTRYGKWTLTVRSGRNLVHFETFEHKNDMRRANKRALARWPQGSGFSVQMGEMNEEAAGLMGIPPQMLDMMGKTLNLSAAQKDALEQLKFQLNPAQSFSKRFLHRSEVPGFSEDAQRNYAHYMFHHAKHYTRVKYEGSLREQVKAVRDARWLRGNDATKLLGIGNYMVDHLDEFLNPKADAASLRSAIAVWYLGFSPQSAVLNMTQLGFATAPYLASKFSDVKALRVMHGVVGAMVKERVVSAKNAFSANPTPVMSQEEMSAIGEAVTEGILDESQAAQLASLAEGTNLLGNVPGTPTRRQWMQFTGLAMLMFQQTEKFNRHVTFRSAWRLAKQNPQQRWVQDLQGKHQLQLQRLLGLGWTQENALAFLAGKEAVQSTQYEYAKYARPRFMRGRAGVVFMFYLFTQNMLFMLWNNPGTIPRYMLLMMLMGGMMGLPGLEDADDIVKAIAARFDKDWDIQKSVRKTVTEIMDSTWAADMVLRGIARESLGIPALLDLAGISWFPKIDMSKQISMGRVLPMSPAPLINPGTSVERALTDALVENAGAAFGVGFNLWNAMSDPYTPWSDFKTWERAMPKSARNAFQAWRVYAEGMERDRTGATVTTFDRDDPSQVAEVIALALGFKPTELNRAWDFRIQQLETQKFWEIRREMVIGQKTRAVQRKDKDASAAATAAIKRYNEQAPPSLRISSESLRESVETRIRKAKKRSLGIPVTRKDISVLRETQEMFPPIRRLKTLEGAGTD